jgi:hypothetical protein
MHTLTNLGENPKRYLIPTDEKKLVTPEVIGNAMARPTSLNRARRQILACFSASPQRIYSEIEVAGVLREKRHAWKLAKSASTDDFISFLEINGELKSYDFRSELYGRKITRYSWGDASLRQLALSLK